MSLRNRLQGRETQFHIELLYGFLFIAGFGYLVFRVDPRVAAFEGGLVVGYLLRIWEKMSIYERILEEVVSREAEAQVEAEVEAHVADEIEQQVDEEVDERLGEEVQAHVADEFGNIDEQIDQRVTERLEAAEESRSDQSDSSTA